MAKASIEINSGSRPTEADLEGEAVSLFFETLSAIGMSDKEAAYTMGLDPAQLSRVKSRQARLPFDAIWRLPTRFWLEFRTRIDASKGLTVENRRATNIARIAELLKLLIEEAVA